MKRARKNPIKPGLIAADETTCDLTMPAPSGTGQLGSSLMNADRLGADQLKKGQILWIGFVSDQDEVETEMDWVRTSLAIQFDVQVALFKDSSDAVSQVAHWSEQNHLANAASPVFISSRYRSDDLVEVIKSLKSNLPACKIYCILGQWWVGHKRTLPLPTGTPIFYWYELYDLLLPEMKKSQQSASKLDSAASSRVMSESALVCSNDPELRRMWGESLRHYGIHTVALIDFDAIPESQFDYILVDADSNQTASPSVDCDLVDTDRLERLPRLVATLRRRFPNSVIATLMGFPDWQSTQTVLKSGANFVAGKPCRVAGLVSSLRSFVIVPE